MKVGYGPMSLIRFWAADKENLPHLSYILHKPEPLGTEFNTVDCSVTGAFIFIYIHIIE